MDFSLVYLANRFLYRLARFAENWYVGAFYAFNHHTRVLLTSFDQTFAIRITLKNLGKPLYGDYSVAGRALGYVFRILRVISGAAMYVGVIAVAGALYAAWALLPFYIIIRPFF